MNLARILEQSVEDLPALRVRLGPPRPHPDLVVREHHEDEGTIYKALIPGGRPPHYFRFTEFQWKICRLFDGRRTPEMVVEAAEAREGIRLSLKDVEHFVELLDQDGFWHRTPQEESVALCQQMLEKRHQREQDHGDLSLIVLTRFDPDRMLTWIYRHISFVYSRWFSLWSVFMLLVMFIILGSHWQQVWNDSIEYYRLTSRGLAHFLVFLLVFVLMGVVHEGSHGLTCKHFGGEVHGMGVNLVYLAPCVFCDVSEVWVYGGRRERMLTVFAGVWAEIVLCSYASVVWWLTPPGTLAHQVTYLTILAGGIFSAMVNWNPLSKMDGYMLLTEYFRIRDVKVAATTWLVSWVRKNVFHLSATVQPISLKRSIGYTVYAILAGAYSYFLLLFFARVTYSLFHQYTPQWAFLPAGLLAYRIFRSRIRKLAHFMKELYLDKKAILREHRGWLIAGAAVLLVLGVLPLRRQTIQERFLLEPAQASVLRAQVPGRVVEIAAREGQAVAAGSTLARMTDVSVRSKTARAAADYQIAGARVIDAQLNYADLAAAQQRLRATRADYQAARDRQQELSIVSPIAGVVVTPRAADLLGTFIKEGTVVAEVADLSSVRAKIFVPDAEMHKLQQIHEVRLRMDSEWAPVRGKVISISPASQPPSQGLIATPEYKGIALPQFFVVTVDVSNPAGRLRDGLTGTAKIQGARRSFFGGLLEPVLAAAARRVW